MRYLSHCVVAFLVCTPILAHAQMSAESPEVEGERKSKLEAGEILVETSNEDDGIHTDLIGVVDAPPEQVWEVISDYDSQSEWMPDLKEESRVLEREDGDEICLSANDFPWPLADRTYKLRYRYEQETVDGVERFVATWSYVDGSGNIDDIDGYWLVQPFDGDDERTLVRQQTIVDLGVSVPGFLMKRGSRNKLPNIIEALRERVGTLTAP